MTMTTEQIHKYVLTYLESMECQVLEQSPYHVMVKLSPEADKELTGRPYYWGFIERTNTEPETMSFLFVFDPEKYEQAEIAKTAQANESRRAALHTQLNKPLITSGEAAASSSPSQTEDSILGRYFGVVRPLPNVGPGRIHREHLHFGSPRLQQIFTAARRGGSCVYLFEDAGPRQRATLFPAAYEPWLGISFKVEFACDMKREELHFMGISLVSQKIDFHFRDRLSTRSLVPRLPENVHIEPSSMTPAEARDALEASLQSKLSELDSSWAVEAAERLQEELELIDAYYEDLLLEEDEEKRNSAREQYEARREEIRWQYEPRILVTAINCGIFHLRQEHAGRNEHYR
ncbi:YqhG family protein [Paenibacillus sp. YPG26]|uniref:YqhG family protein n=1 Tax=Paenibacillus sp. YPG26 TaxID=2878915 RepID=UPI00203BFC24|nr:YqhG family protein [Paenibacillus sp. YPG26]USB32198.1 YqhG family protein [Paenibacillus sp. YPG26]